MQRINRKAHVGKSPNEKEAYRNFLSQRFTLDKTEEDPENPSKTNSSNFDSEDLNNIKPQGKSLILKIKDFFRSNWTITIVGGLIVLIIGWVFTFTFNQGAQGEKISNIETRVGKVEGKIDGLTANVGELNTNVNGMQIEFSKDVEFIKDRLSGKK
ncbi:MAG: hypothetical protein ABIG99_00805 [Patescibacteria group bacterium]